MLMKTKE